MNILFIGQEENNEEKIKKLFMDINLQVEYISFKKYNKNINFIDFVKFDFVFIELIGEDKNKIESIKKLQKEKILNLINLIYVFEEINLNLLIKNMNFVKFDCIFKPLLADNIQEKIKLYENKKTNSFFEDYKMIVKGKLLRPLEHQWKQPLNLISTSLVNLELKSELSRLSKQDINITSEKIEFAVTKISNTLSNLNECFKNSQSKTPFTVKEIYERILEFLTPQTMKYNINLNIKEDLEEFSIENYENEFALNLLVLLYAFIQWIIENKDKNEQFDIDFSYDNKDIFIGFSDALPLYEIYTKYTYEFLCIKTLLKKLELAYESLLLEGKTQIKLSF